MLFKLFLKYQFYGLGNEDHIFDLYYNHAYLNFVPACLCLILLVHSFQFIRMDDTASVFNAVKSSLRKVAVPTLLINLITLFLVQFFNPPPPPQSMLYLKFERKFANYILLIIFRPIISLRGCITYTQVRA